MSEYAGVGSLCPAYTTVHSLCSDWSMNRFVKKPVRQLVAQMPHLTNVFPNNELLSILGLRAKGTDMNIDATHWYSASPTLPVIKNNCFTCIYMFSIEAFFSRGKQVAFHIFNNT